MAKAKWKLVSKHEYNLEGALAQYGFALGSIVVGSLLTVLGVLAVIFYNGGEGVARFLMGVPLLLFGVAAVVFGVKTIPRHKVEWVKVYAEGIKWKVRGQEYKQRWEDAVAVDQFESEAVNDYGQRSEMLSVSTLDLKFKSGASVSFDPAISDYFRLVRKVKEAVAARNGTVPADE